MDIVEQKETKRNGTERNRTERNETLRNIAVPYRALFSETKRYCIERFWKRFFDAYCTSVKYIMLRM